MSAAARLAERTAGDTAERVAERWARGVIDPDTRAETIAEVGTLLQDAGDEYSVETVTDFLTVFARQYKETISDEDLHALGAAVAVKGSSTSEQICERWAFGIRGAGASVNEQHPIVTEVSQLFEAQGFSQFTTEKVRDFLVAYAGTYKDTLTDEDFFAVAKRQDFITGRIADPNTDDPRVEESIRERWALEAHNELRSSDATWLLRGLLRAGGFRYTPEAAPKYLKALATDYIRTKTRKIDVRLAELGSASSGGRLTLLYAKYRIGLTPYQGIATEYESLKQKRGRIAQLLNGIDIPNPDDIEALREPAGLSRLQIQEMLSLWENITGRKASDFVPEPRSGALARVRGGQRAVARAASPSVAENIRRVLGDEQSSLTEPAEDVSVPAGPSPSDLSLVEMAVIVINGHNALLRNTGLPASPAREVLNRYYVRYRDANEGGRTDILRRVCGLFPAEYRDSPDELEALVMEFLMEPVGNYIGGIPGVQQEDEAARQQREVRRASDKDKSAVTADVRKRNQTARNARSAALARVAEATRQQTERSWQREIGALTGQIQAGREDSRKAETELSLTEAKSELAPVALSPSAPSVDPKVLSARLEKFVAGSGLNLNSFEWYKDRRGKLSHVLKGRHEIHMYDSDIYRVFSTIWPPDKQFSATEVEDIRNFLVAVEPDIIKGAGGSERLNNWLLDQIRAKNWLYVVFPSFSEDWLNAQPDTNRRNLLLRDCVAFEGISKAGFGLALGVSKGAINHWTRAPDDEGAIFDHEYLGAMLSTLAPSREAYASGWRMAEYPEHTHLYAVNMRRLVLDVIPDLNTPQGEEFIAHQTESGWQANSFLTTNVPSPFLLALPDERQAGWLLQDLRKARKLNPRALSEILHHHERHVLNMEAGITTVDVSKHEPETVIDALNLFDDRDEHAGVNTDGRYPYSEFIKVVERSQAARTDEMEQKAVRAAQSEVQRVNAIRETIRKTKAEKATRELDEAGDRLTLRQILPLVRMELELTLPEMAERLRVSRDTVRKNLERGEYVYPERMRAYLELSPRRRGILIAVYKRETGIDLSDLPHESAGTKASLPDVTIPPPVAHAATPEDTTVSGHTVAGNTGTGALLEKDEPEPVPPTTSGAGTASASVHRSSGHAAPVDIGLIHIGDVKRDIVAAYRAERRSEMLRGGVPDFFRRLRSRYSESNPGSLVPIINEVSAVLAAARDAVEDEAKKVTVWSPEEIVAAIWDRQARVPSLPASLTVSGMEVRNPSSTAPGAYITPDDPQYHHSEISDAKGTGTAKDGPS